MKTTYRASKAITLVVACLVFFMVLLDTSIVNARRSLSTSVEPADSQATTRASTIPQVASVVEVEHGVLLERGEQA